MKKKYARLLGWLLAGSLVAGSTFLPWEFTDTNNRVMAATEESIEVSDETGFMNALARKDRQIVVKGRITIGSQAESNGQMLPVQIPENTRITGNGTGSIVSRSPIEIMGDNVTICDMEWVFNSTNAMNSVPHREIYLAGHSLTFDNVSTYLEGGNGSLGGMAGTEKELLPSVYAGGYHNNGSVGENAVFTVCHANKKTMFQNIYMGHKGSSGERTPYTGKATLVLDGAAKVRDGIETEQNTQAEIRITGEQDDEISLQSIKGNKATTLQVSQCTLLGETIENVGQIIVEQGGMVKPGNGTTSMENIKITGNSCLDLSEITNGIIQGDFAGAEDGTKGIFVLSQRGSVEIKGQVTGVTQFQVGNRVIPGTLYDKQEYITAVNSTGDNFVLSERDRNNGYHFLLKNGIWTAYRNYDSSQREVGKIETKSVPSFAYIGNVINTIDEATEDSVFLQAVWRDEDGNAFTPQEVYENAFYENVVCIRSQYWQDTSTANDGKKDWSNPIRLESADMTSEKYYLLSYGEVQEGEYTFLFLGEYPDELETVGDVKKLKDSVKGSVNITFSNTKEPTTSINPTPSTTASTKPTASVNPTPSTTASTKPTTSINPTPSTTASTKPTASINPTPSATTSVKPTSSATASVKPTASAKPTSSATASVKPTASAKPTQTASVKPTPSATVSPKPTTSVKPTPTEVALPLPKMIELSKNAYTYDGKNKKPKVVVKDAEGKAISSKYYKITYSRNREIGDATVKVTFHGKYTGSLQKKFTIYPARMVISKIKSQKKGFTLFWKKTKGNIDGIQIQYSLKSNFAKAKTRSVSGKNIRSLQKTILGQKRKTKYYVRICAYKTITLQGKKRKIDSAWSKTKTIKTKK